MLNVETVVGFEPDAVMVNDADDCYRDAQLSCRQRGNAIKSAVWGCIEDGEASNRRQSVTLDIEIVGAGKIR